MHDFIDLKSIGVSKALLTPTEVENVFGKRYFYRMRLYRWEKEGYLRDFKNGNKKYYYAGDIIKAAEQSLRDKLRGFLGKTYNFEINFLIREREITVHGLDPKSNKHWGVFVDTMNKNETSLVLKILKQMSMAKTFWAESKVGR